MSEEERRQWIEQLTAQIERAEQELYRLQQTIDAGTATPQMQKRFHALHVRRDAMMKLRRQLELHHDYVAAKASVLL